MERKHWKWVIIGGAVCVLALIGHLSGEERRTSADRTKKEKRAAHTKLLKAAAQASPNMVIIGRDSAIGIHVGDFIPKYIHNDSGVSAKRHHKISIVYFDIFVMPWSANPFAATHQQFKLKTIKGRMFPAALYEIHSFKKRKYVRNPIVPPGKRAVGVVYFSVPKRTNIETASFGFIAENGKADWFSLTTVGKQNNQEKNRKKLASLLTQM